MESYRRNNSANQLPPLILDEVLQMENDLQQNAFSKPVTNMQFRSALKYFDILKKFETELEIADEETKVYFQSTFSYFQEDKFIKAMAKKINLSELQLKFLFEVGRTL